MARANARYSCSIPLNWCLDRRYNSIDLRHDVRSAVLSSFYVVVLAGLLPVGKSWSLKQAIVARTGVWGVLEEKMCRAKFFLGKFKDLNFFFFADSPGDACLPCFIKI